MRIGITLSDRTHEALRLLQGITGRTCSDIVNELVLAEVERMGLVGELDELVAQSTLGAAMCAYRSPVRTI